MAVRPIDGNELYRIEKLLDTDIVRQDKVALNLLHEDEWRGLHKEE